jgi:hypothetical protein
MTTLQRDEAVLTTHLSLGPFSNKRHDVKVLILNMVATSNVISCSHSSTSCMTDSVQLCHILVAEFTPWHTSLGGKLIPPSSMPTCAALHQKAAYKSNPSRPSLIWNLLWRATALLSTVLFPSFLCNFLLTLNLKYQNTVCGQYCPNLQFIY